MNRRKKRIGFSVLDMVLILLVLACILSSVFQDQIRSFLGEEIGPRVEYTFLIQNVTKEAKNHPLIGEEILLSDSGESIGTLLSVESKKNVFQSQDNPDDQVEILTLTCKASAVVEERENGYEIGGILIKPGAELSVETLSASFVMVITMVKTVE